MTIYLYSYATKKWYANKIKDANTLDKLRNEGYVARVYPPASPATEDEINLAMQCVANKVVVL